MEPPKNYVNKFVILYGKNPLTRKLFQWPAAGLTLHWLNQSMTNMDKTELIFKLCIDFVLTIIFSLLLGFFLNFYVAILMGLFLAHTINFIFNAHFWVVLKNFGYINLTQQNFENYVRSLSSRIKEAPCITYAAIYGSLAREEGWRSSSDLDLRLIRKKGLINALRACSFVIFERSRAIFGKFPLDVYLLDSSKPLDRMRKDEKPIIIKNTSEIHFEKNEHT